MGINIKNKGFSLIEILVVLAVVGTLVGIATISLGASKQKTRDTKRKADISEIGRFLALGCYLPEQGGGKYDVADIIDELKTKYPKQVKYLSGGPLWDPTLGSANETFYKYEVADDGEHCVLYSNLESKTAIVTLENISIPTMGGQSGIFESNTEGWNGTRKYYQMSK